MTDASILRSSDVAHALRNAGVLPGETVCVHSFLGAFGKLEANEKTVFDGFMEAIGPQGTLLVPTFNYDFFKGAVYNPSKTRSQVGQFSEYCRLRADSSRTSHPIYSHVVFGSKRRLYLTQPNLSAFGEGSIFALMKEENVRIVGFGISFSFATFIHHVEEFLRVPYRYDLVQKGEIEDDGKRAEIEVPVFARYLELDPPPQIDLVPLQNEMIKAGAAHKVTLGRGEIVTALSRDLFDFAIRGYRKDPMYFLEVPLTMSQIPTCPNDKRIKK